jgi:hypothetical protein
MNSVQVRCVWTQYHKGIDVKALLIALIACGGLSAGGALGLRLMTAEVDEDDGLTAQILTSTPATGTPTPGPSTSPSKAPVRPDCPSDWRVYENPDALFSFCYPASMELFPAQPAAPVEIPPELQQLIDQGLATPPAAPPFSSVQVSDPPNKDADLTRPDTVYTGDRIVLDLGYTHQWSVEAFGPDTKCLDEMWDVKNQTTTVAQLSGRSVQACYQEVSFRGSERGDPKLLYKAMYFPLLQRAPGDIVGGTVLWTGPNWDGTESLAKQIVATIRARQDTP